jgi:hypothetical protein
MAQLARPPCAVPGCGRKASARIAGKWLCSSHIRELESDARNRAS